MQSRVYCNQHTDTRIGTCVTVNAALLCVLIKLPCSIFSLLHPQCVCNTAVWRWLGLTLSMMSQSSSMLCSTMTWLFLSIGQLMRTHHMPTTCITCMPTWLCWINFAGMHLSLTCVCNCCWYIVVVVIYIAQFYFNLQQWITAVYTQPFKCLTFSFACMLKIDNKFIGSLKRFQKPRLLWRMW